MAQDERYLEMVRIIVRRGFELAGEDRLEFARCLGSSLRDANRWINFAYNLHTNNKACPSTLWLMAICEYLREEGGDDSLPSVFLN